MPVSAEPPPTSGIFGENSLLWEFEDGVLTITGTGDMPNWAWGDNPPWDGHRVSIVSVIVEDGVTSIGDYAFHGPSNYANIESVTIGSSVISIGQGAFQNCTSLTSVTIGSSVTKIGGVAFQNCTNLTSVTFLSPTPPPPTDVASNALLDVPLENLKITVPQGARGAYDAALKLLFGGSSNFDFDNNLKEDDSTDDDDKKEETNNTSPYIFTPPPVYVAPVVEDYYEEIVQTPEPVVDDSVVQMSERNGVLYVTLTAANIAALRGDDGVVTLDLTGYDDIRLTIALGGFDVGDVLVVITDSGTIKLTGAMLAAMRGDTMTLRLGKA